MATAWVVDSGLLLMLEGHWDGRNTVLQGIAPGADGALTQQRITWSPSPDGSVRQLWEWKTVKAYGLSWLPAGTKH